MEHLDDRLFAQFIAIIQSDEFSAMRRIAGDRPLPFSEFKTLPAPAGITQEQAWTLLCAMRKTVAITIPLTDAEGRRGWYSPTQSIARNLAEIDRACKENSALDLAISSKNTTYFLLESNIDDAIEAIRGDGLSMGHERARELILEERLPETPEEQLFANVRRVQHALKSPALPRSSSTSTNAWPKAWAPKSTIPFPNSRSSGKKAGSRRKTPCSLSRKSSKARRSTATSTRSCWPSACATSL